MNCLSLNWLRLLRCAKVISAFLFLFMPQASFCHSRCVRCDFVAYIPLIQLCPSFSALLAPRMVETFDIPKCFTSKHFNDLTLMKWRARMKKTQLQMIKSNAKTNSYLQSLLKCRQFAVVVVERHFCAFSFN